MTEEILRSWLAAYGRAWETRDPEAVVALFTEAGTYQETPFAEAMRGRPAIAAYWPRATGPHTHVHFDYELLALDRNQGIAHWWCSFVRVPPKASLKLDGIFVLEFERGTLRVASRVVASGGEPDSVNISFLPLS